MGYGMGHTAAARFLEWQIELETEPQLCALRLLTPGGGAVWRNASAREYYAQHGFPTAPVLDWKTIKPMLCRSELQALRGIYLAAFNSNEPVVHTHTSQMPGYPPCSTETDYLAVYGTIKHGIILARLRPLTLPPAQVIYLPSSFQTSSTPRAMA